jgi:regulator of sigma E protease
MMDLTNIFGTFRSIGIALLVLGIIIVLHELGHFLVAKLFKIKVETFSVGFGPRLIGFRYGETDYRISAFPLGGYVKMAGENPGDSVTGAPNEFLSKPKWQRFLVASAGPVMNIILAVGLLTGLFMYGTEVPEFAEGEAVVGTVDANSPAQAAGIQEGDRIVAIDEVETRPNWEQVEARVMINGNHTIPVTLNRNGKVIETSLTPVKQGPNEAGYSGMRPKSRVTNVIGYVQPDSPAAEGGLQPGDEITAVNGINLKESGRGVSEIIQSNTLESLPVTVLRAGQVKELTVKPTLTDGKRMIGVGWFRFPTIMVKEDFRGALSRSIDKNVEYGTLIFKVLGKLVRREASMKTVDGPLGIMKQTAEFYEIGIGALLQLMAMISLNLGLMNLLPIPILDGGVMLLLLVEGIMRQDLSLAFKERVVQVSFVFLLTLMVFVLYNDVVKWVASTPVGP